MDKVFLKCEVCGNLVGMLHDGGAPMTCCGKTMSRLVPNTTDASVEKHVPSVKVEGYTVTVQIGEAPHPMEAAHHIEWIMVNQGAKTQRIALTPDSAPIAVFECSPDDGNNISVYCYCNLHGLWKRGMEL